MQTLHTLRLPAPPAAGPLAGLSASLIGRPIAALIDAWRRQGRHRATLRTLHAIDDRTLRDLGLHRSEIGALAAEIGGRAEITYVRAQQVHLLCA
jgi:uncharacterized protein YjiS (DUF1127 family)